MNKSKGFASFFAFVFMTAVGVVCASVVDNIVKFKLVERLEVVRAGLQSKKLESSETAKVMLYLSEFENVVRATKFFEISSIKSQVNTVNHIEMFVKDSYLTKDELAKLQSKNICAVSLVSQSSRQIASQKDKQKK